jgi:hypothetical protein
VQLFRFNHLTSKKSEGAQLRMCRSAKNQKGDYRQRSKDSARYQTTGIAGERKAKDCTDQPGSKH